jgi:transcription antitermination factor NusG
MGRGNDGHSASDWCILRMSGPGTLGLVASLQDAGMDVWTPTEHIKRRVPRSKSTEHRIVPLAPTYAFVRRAHLADLQRIERMDVSPHPRFSIFRYYGETVYVRHRELSPLRSMQQDSYRSSLPASGRAPGKARGLAYDVGDEVTFTTGSFTGFKGFVDVSDGLTTTVIISLFGRAQEVKVETLQLRSRNVPVRKQAA